MNCDLMSSNSRDSYGDCYSSVSVGKTLQKEEFLNMSLCCSFSFADGKTYIMSDSRSSKATEISQFGDVIKLEAISDDYRKIAKLNIKNRTIIAYSTGVNVFGRDSFTFTDYISQFSFPQNTPFKSIANILFDSFCEINRNIGICLRMFEYDKNENLHCAYFNTKIHNAPYILENNFTHGDLFRCTNGDNLAVATFERFQFSLNGDEALLIKEINEAFEKIKEPSLNNPVGGPVHILKLTPGQSPVWLQNGYTL